MTSQTSIDITPSPRLLQVLGDIPLQPWQCLAELVDNSLDELLKQPSRNEANPLQVDILVEDLGSQGTFLTVSDNGFGMSESELERSLRAGHSAKNRYGSLGLFGMGFNIATARLGNITTVSTTQAGSESLMRATIDFADLKRRESFSVPLEIVPVEAEESGTTVRVKLKREMAETFRRPATQKTLMSQLGDVYSYLLREGVPGINRDGMSSQIPAILRFNGEAITPKLPCVWSDQRSVTSYGQQVNAVQYVDLRLTEATACLDCGYWDRKNGPEFCEECGSSNLDVRERRIWGWLGIQRYIDSSNFGIDFIRYGRKILKQDKSIFVYTDPDTLQSDAEYPIEMPANQGRIVGEIHLDHVPVTYQKNDFDRQSFDWQKAIEVVRGNGPLKPKGAREVNDSPLAVLYSAFRRNDPGLRYLTPGDGTRALHTKAKEWAALFDKGIPRMLEDTEWFEAAARHQRIKDGTESDTDSDSGTSSSSATSAVDSLLGKGAGTSTPEVQEEPKVSQSDILESARLLGTRRDDLSGTFKLSRTLGTWDLIVIATRENLRDASGNSVPAIPGTVKGTSIEIFVATEHPVFREFGRDSRDVALVQAAGLIRDLSSSDMSVASIYSEMVQEIADLKVTAPAILERIDRTLDRVRALALPVVADNPGAFWNLLDGSEKQSVEELAALRFPMQRLEALVDDGGFVLFVSAETLAKIVQEQAPLLFDGVVFKPSLVHRTGPSRDRIIGMLVRSLLSLAAFQQDDLMRQKHDMQLVQISLDILDEQINSEELLS